MSFISRRIQAVVAAAGLGLAFASSVADSASAAGPFRPFLGSWRGGGEITSSDGRKEPISCRATYEGDNGDTSLTMSMVCASDAFRLNIEFSATAEDGNMRGEWRETTRGVQGSLSGQIGGGDFEGQVNGGGFTAQMSVRSNGRKQAMYLQPSAGDVRSVNVVMTRSR